MEETLLLIERYQAWIYLILIGTGLIYLRLILKWSAEVRRSMFGLEREQALGKRSRAVGMLILVFSLSVALFLVSTFAAPALPISVHPTPVPTISLLPATQAFVDPGSPTLQVATSFPQDQFGEVTCQNTNATLSSPADGEELRGVVSVEGTANIPSFAFFKIEFRSDEANAVWRAISAGTEIVVEGELGRWDTSLIDAGDYLFRLVVTDTAGNAPMPCTIRVRVLPNS